MVPAGPATRRHAKSTVAGAIAGLCAVLLAQAVSPPGALAYTNSDSAPLSGAMILDAAGLAGLTEQPDTRKPSPLGTPTSTDSVTLHSDLTMTSAPRGTTLVDDTSGADTLAVSPGPSAATLAAVNTNKVSLKALVIAVDATDFGLPTWTTMLGRVGAAYDVLHAKTAPLTADVLVGPDGTGRYNAILLTDSMLLYQDDSGNFVSGLNADQWNLLWAYERDYQVRQATLYSSYGTFPEDYCTRAGTEGSVGDEPLTASLTSAGASVFDYLKSTARIPIVQSYVYRTTLAVGCSAQPILTVGSSVLGVLSTSTDGRQRVALTYTSNQHLMQANVLTYGLFRWASRGLHFGEQRHYLTMDVDDWFNSSDHLYPDGHLETDPGFTLTAHAAYNAYVQQAALRKAYPLASGFKMGMAYNGGDANLNAGTKCSPSGGVAQLTATTRCLKKEFTWINHTVSHPELNNTDYATTLAEINGNLAIAQSLSLPVDRTVLKTPEYSGLGVYNPNPDDDLSPPTDFGLAASNPSMLAAAKTAGVRYLHGNMSFASHVPSCFNCAIVHPMEPSLLVVPDWPTNVAYHVTTPTEQTYFYNSFYGPNGRFPFWPTDLTYAQLMDYEAEIALGHVTTGSVYTHTFHISNLNDYGSGRTLATDWAAAVMAKYSSYYNVPLLSPGWPALAKYAEARNAHFAALANGVEAVYDRTAKTVTVSSPVDATATVSGARTAGYSTYGKEFSASIKLTATAPVTFTPILRS